MSVAKVDDILVLYMTNNGTYKYMMHDLTKNIYIYDARHVALVTFWCAAIEIAFI